MPHQQHQTPPKEGLALTLSYRYNNCFTPQKQICSALFSFLFSSFLSIPFLSIPFPS